MKKLILSGLVLIGLTSCEKPETKKEKLLTLKVTFLDGKTDTLRANGNSYDVYTTDQYGIKNYLSVGTTTIAYDLKSVSLIKEETK